MSIVSNRYSEALFDLAVEENKVSQFYEELLVIKTIFNSNEEFNEVLAHPEIMLSEKIDIVKSVFTSTSSLILNFLLVLVEKSRTKEIISIIDDFELYYNEYYNIENAIVYSVVPLTNSQISKLELQLSDKFSKQVKVKNIIDKSIIGGIRIVIKNTVIDTSLKSRIKELDDHIRQIQLK